MNTAHKAQRAWHRRTQDTKSMAQANTARKERAAGEHSTRRACRSGTKHTGSILWLSTGAADGEGRAPGTWGTARGRQFYEEDYLCDRK